MSLWIETPIYYEWKGKQGTEEWLTYKRFYIGGSMSFKVYENYPEAIEFIKGNKKVEQNERMRLGNYWEPYVRNLYMNLTGNKVTETGLFISKKDPLFLYSPDGLVYDSREEDPNGLLEIKCVEKMYEPLLKDNTMWNSHKCQIHQGMFLTERYWTDYMVYCYTDKSYYVKRFDYEEVFWDNIYEDICKNVEPDRAELESKTFKPTSVLIE